MRDQDVIASLSELGVLLLMFALGVEFSLAQFRQLRMLGTAKALRYLSEHK